MRYDHYRGRRCQRVKKPRIMSHSFIMFHVTLTAKFNLVPKIMVGLCNEDYFILCEAGS